MDTDDVSRRRVMKGVGMMTSTRLVTNNESNGCRSDSRQQKENSNEADIDVAQQLWPQSGGTAAKTGRRRGASGPKSSVAFRWQFEGSSQISGVVVADAVVYGSDNTTLYALSAADGDELWTVGDERQLTSVSAPAVDNTLVYVGCTRRQRTATKSPDGRSHVRALDAATGTEEWRFELDRAAATFSAPTVAGENIYIIGGNFGAGTIGQLYALDGASGELLWRQETGPSGISGYKTAPVAIESDVVYLAADTLLALDAATGEVYWAVDPELTYKAMGTNAPTVADGRLYVGRGTETAATFEARSVSDGSRAWTHTVETETETETNPDTGIQNGAGTGLWTGAAVDDDTVYVGFNERTTQKERSAHILALSTDEGTVRWQRSFSSDRLVVQTPAITEETLYTGGVALRRDDGHVRWRIDSPTADRMNEFAPPAVADDTVYVGGPSLRAITGRE